MRLNKEFKLLVKKHYTIIKQEITCNLHQLIITFPKIIKIRISPRANILDSDFENINNIEYLNMALCKQPTITNIAFRNLTRLKHLNLQGACGHWIGGHHFTDEMFLYLTQLEWLYIDDNHVITNEGIKLLTNITNLSIHNCCNISNDGLENLTTLTKLDIYNLVRLSDNVFIKLFNLEELNITFASFTSTIYKYLPKLKKLSLCGLSTINFSEINILTNLTYLSLCYVKIKYSELKSLSHIRHISFYGCNFTSDEEVLPLFLLENVQILSIYECTITIEDILPLNQLKCLNKLNIYRCKNIKFDEETQLKKIFPFFN